MGIRIRARQPLLNIHLALAKSLPENCSISIGTLDN
jgi:hypothetical protein